MTHPPTPLEVALAEATLTIGGETERLVSLDHSIALPTHFMDRRERDIPAVRVFRQNRGKWLEENAGSNEEARERSRCISRLCAAANGTLAVITCHECGETAEARYMASVTRRLVAERVCHTCDFWVGQLKAEPEKRVVINGTHYRLGSLTLGGRKESKGFGGRVHRIRFHDGREVVCDDLWYQGKIPDHFAARHPDNAEFIKAAS